MRLFVLATIALACLTGCSPSPGTDFAQQSSLQGNGDLPANSTREFGNKSTEPMPAYQSSGDHTWDLANELLNDIK